MSGLGQSAVVNVLQGLGAQKIKTLADGLGDETTTKDKDGRDVTTFTPTTESELLRGALQGIAGCAAGAAGGSGDCGSAALGAASSVAINLLIDSLKDQKDEATFDTDGNQTDADTAGDLQHSRDVTALIGLIAEALDLDPNAASVAGQIETENNQLGRNTSSPIVANTPCPDEASCTAGWIAFFESAKGQLAWAAAGQDTGKAIACITGTEACADVDARYAKLLAAFGGNVVGLSGEDVFNAISEIDAAKSTLDQLFGKDEVKKTLARQFLADGKITANGLATLVAQAEQQGGSAKSLYDTIVSFFSSGDEVEPDFETDTTPSGDPNDPKDVGSALITATFLALYAGAEESGVDLGNPLEFFPDQDGFTEDGRPIFRDPQTGETYVLDEQGNKQDAPEPSTPSANNGDDGPDSPYIVPRPFEELVGSTEDGLPIYKDQFGNEYVKDHAGRNIPLHEYESGAANQSGRASDGTIIFDEGTTAAANRLGFDPSDVRIKDGVADIPIIFTDDVSIRDLRAVTRALKEQGATSVRVNTGPIINPGITPRSARAADEGRTFMGFKVRRTGDPDNPFILEKDL